MSKESNAVIVADFTQNAESKQLGYVESVSSGRISGWVRRDLILQNFVVIIDDAEHTIKPTFARRGDLDSAGLDALGFEAQLRANLTDDSSVSVACVSRDGERVIIPITGPQARSAATEAWAGAHGYIDFASLTEVSGWVRPSIRKRRFFVEIDGVAQVIQPRFFPRTDLMDAGVDGLGFTAYIDADQTDFELSCGFNGESSGEEKNYFAFSTNGKASVRISEPNPSRIVMTAEELAEVASAIEPDSVLYTSFVKKFGAALAGVDVKFDVLFIDGSLGSVSTRYRIVNVADGLRELGYTALYARLDGADLQRLSKVKARVVVFFRAPLDENYEFLVKAFRAGGSRIVFDVDDLVFDESIIPSIDGVRYLSNEDMEGYVWGVRHYRRFALNADLVTTATRYLADYARTTLGCAAVQVRNTIGKGYLKHYSDEVTGYDRGGDGFVIGYYSGSKTHQADFQEAYPALVRFLKTYPDVVLRVVGMFDLEEFPDLDPLRGRIVSVPMLAYHEMIADLGNCDVVIAPLTVGNAFCESKSELKFFEAALRGRPCISSATGTYSLATAEGRYGPVARTTEEWFSALSRLYLSPQARRTLAREARAYVRAEYSYETAGREAASAYFGLPRLAAPARAARSEPAKAKKSLSIGVVIPAIVVGGGGHRKILKFCHDWARDGHQLTLYVDSTEHPESIRQQISAHFYQFPCEIRNHRGSVGSHSVIVCTHWKTAFSLRSYPEPHKVIYFVQDFEAMFDPVNSNYVKAIATYRLGFNIACYGRWVANRLRRELDLDPGVVPFSMDKGIYRLNPRAAKVLDVLFFARPSQPRRCFELGIEALKLVYRANPSVRIGVYGEHAYGDLGIPCHNFGLITDLRKLCELYQRAKLGICFSSTNPSLVGYEMLACGLPLVDLRLPGCEVNFNGDQFVYYADPTPESIYTVIADALNNDIERNRRVAAGAAYIASMPDDSVIGEHLMGIVKRVATRA